MAEPKSFAIFGLGRFGTSIVTHLSTHDVEILACDKNVARVEEISDIVDQAVAGDASDEEFLKRVEVNHFDVVVFAMGEQFETAVMATLSAKELGCKRVVVKALTDRQAEILKRVGADRVVLPEVEMGAKVARSLLNPSILDVFNAVDGISITERHPEPEWVGKTLTDADVRRTANISIIGMIRDGKTSIPVRTDETLREDDVLLTLDNE